MKPRSDTLNEVEMNGKTFTALSAGENGCAACCFYQKKACMEQPSLCGSVLRDDRRNVIWLEKIS